MFQQQFVHLNVHTENSLKDSIIRVPSLVKATKEAGMPSIAISDSSNFFASIQQYKKSIAAGLKPILAMEVNVMMDEDSKFEIGKMILVVKNNVGYKNLIQMISDGYENGTESTGRDPIIEFNDLERLSDGLVALSGARKGSIGKALLSGRNDDASKQIEKMKSVFGSDFYLELQRTNHPDDDRHVHAAVSKAVEHSVPVVATNSVMFLEPSEYRTHEVRAAIAEGVTVSQFRENKSFEYTQEQYLKTPEEMAEIFADIPSAIENTVTIARQCNVEIELGKPYLPAFPDSQKANMSESDYLRKISYEGLENRLVQLFGKDTPEYFEKVDEYKERLEFELNTVIDMGFPGYFLIVADFIQWSKDNDIPVGPGRGSGAGSIIAYAINITDLDPIEYDLLFERFLNPERVSMPDFDIDFCMDGRDKVIEYTANKYGKEAVSQIITYGTMAAKMVVRDVARALGYPFAVGNRISNMIPAKPGTKLQEAIDENTEFQFAIETDSEVKAVIEHSLRLEGLRRQTGKHAGGVLIAPGKLTDFTATYNEIDKEGNVINKVSQLDKNDVEEAGLVKFDYLGLKTLTIIHNAVKNINKRMAKEGKSPVDITSIPLNDPEVFELFQRGETTAVFQVESKGMKDLLKRLRPDCFEDIIALVALYRPGPLESGMVTNFINRKHGREEISYPDATYQHELLKPILEPTYGVILYQEQVMQIAQALAGYSLGGADMLRRAMGKKKPEEMAKQRGSFEKGAIENGIDGDLAMKIFDLVEKFAGYGFNKSHSAAYALIAYQTAWLKAHYPAEFMASVLSGDMDNMDKIVTYVNECRSIGIDLLPPDVNKSMKSFHPKNEKEILFGMGAVKGVGDTAIAQMISDREENGEFKTLYDFCMRTNANKRVIEAGIKAGLLDELGPSRASLMATYPKAQQVGKQAAKKEKDTVQIGLFGSIMEDESIVEFEDVPDWNDLHRLSSERKTLGLYLTGHPIEYYEEELEPLVSGKLIDLMGSDMEAGNDDMEATEETVAVKWENKKVTVAGLIMDMDIRSNKKGQTAFLTLDDKSRQVDVMIFNKTLHECQHALEADKMVIIEGDLKMDNRTKRIRLFAKDVKSIDMVRERHAESVHLDLNPSNFGPEQRAQVKALLEAQPMGYARVTAHYKSDQHDREVTLGDYQIQITDNFLNDLKDIVGKSLVSVKYRDKNSTMGVQGTQLSEAQKAVKIAEGQRTFESRRDKLAKLLDHAESVMSM